MMRGDCWVESWDTVGGCEKRYLRDIGTAKKRLVIADFDFGSALEDRGVRHLHVRHECRPIVPNETERHACIGLQNPSLPHLNIRVLNDASNVAAWVRSCRSQRGKAHNNGEG